MKLLFFNCILFILLISKSKSILEFQETLEPSQEFRAAWASPWGGDSDLVTFSSIEQFKQNMTYMLDTFKMYNMNSIIYHFNTTVIISPTSLTPALRVSFLPLM